MLFSTIFTIIFLTFNHLYLTFASPTITEDVVVDDQPLNLTHSLVKRDYIPADQMCAARKYWVARICRPIIDERTFEDECNNIDINNPHHLTTWMLSTCPINTMCMNIVIDDKKTISCIDRPSVPRHVAQNTQTGVSRVASTANLVTERIVEVELVKSISRASVSALLEGSDGNYIVVPTTNLLVGTLGDTSTKACAYNVTNYDCVPTGLFDFRADDKVKFTFALAHLQLVRFYYAIKGN